MRLFQQPDAIIAFQTLFAAAADRYFIACIIADPRFVLFNFRIGLSQPFLQSIDTPPELSFYDEPQSFIPQISFPRTLISLRDH